MAQDPLVYFSFDGYQEEEDGDYPPSAVNSPFIEVGQFARGADLLELANPANDVFSARWWLTSIQSPTDAYYFEFSITPTESNYFNLSKINFKIRRSNEGPQTFVVRSNVENNFGNDVDDQVINLTTSNTFFDISINLDDTYDNVNSVLIFRLYGYNSGDEKGTIQIDNLKIYGEAFDATPPSMITGYPTVSNITQNGFDLTVNTNETGTAYILVQDDGNMPPSTSDVLNNPDQSISINAAATDITIPVNSLNPSTTYDAYIVLEDNQGNASDSPIEVADITTLNLENILVGNGETQTISDDVTVNDYVEIDAGGHLVLEENVTLSLKGDFINKGDFTDQGGTLQFVGTAEQQIRGSSDITSNNITISNTVGVSNETTVTLQGNLKLNENAIFDADGSSDDQSFLLQSTGAQTAQITAIENGATLDGDVTMQRYIGNGPPGWRYLSAPIKNQQTSALQDDFVIQGLDNSYPNADPQLYTYDESKGSGSSSGIDGWVGVKSSAFNISNKGLHVYLFSRDFQDGALVLDYTGKPFIGDGTDNSIGTSGESYELSLDYTPSAFDGGGWNLVQNPYPCKINWNQVQLSANIGASIYIWNPDVENWGVYTQGGSGTNGATQYIASGQSFFVKANAAGQSITFEESDKAESTGNTFLRESHPKDYLKINIAAEEAHYQDELIIRQDINAAQTFDMHRDAFELPNGWINLGAMKDDSTNLCIYSAPIPSGVDTIPLKVIPYYFGKYNMHFDQSDDDSLQFILYDHYTDQTIHPIKVEEYTLDILKNDSASFSKRFEILVLNEVALSVDAETGKMGDTITATVNAIKFRDVHASTFTLNWDTALLNYTGHQLLELAGVGSTDFKQSSDGSLRFNWSMPDGKLVSLKDSSALFDLKFIITGNSDKAGLTFDPKSVNVKSLKDINFPTVINDAVIDIVNRSNIKGKVVDASGKPISKVDINAGNEKISTKNDGTFEFEVVEGNPYKLSAHKSFSDGNENINLVDLLRLRTHLSGTGDLRNGYQMLAADVNYSKSLNETDIDLMKSSILNKSNSGHFNEWLFISGQPSIFNDPFDYDTIRTYEFNDAHPIEFTGIKIGDIDQNSLEYYRSDKTLEFQVRKDGSISRSANVSIIPNDSIVLLGFKFTIHYDPDVLKLKSVSNPRVNSKIMYHKSKQGELVVLWESQTGRPVTFDQSTGLFEMMFEMKNDEADVAEMIKIDTALNQSIAVDKYIEPLRISQKEIVTAIDEKPDKFKLKQNSPNPVQQSTTFRFYLPHEDNLDLSIYNLTGRKIFEHQGSYDKGWHNLNWDLNNLKQGRIEPGIYIYVANTSDAGVTKKLIIQ